MRSMAHAGKRRVWNLGKGLVAFADAAQGEISAMRIAGKKQVLAAHLKQRLRTARSTGHGFALHSMKSLREILLQVRKNPRDTLPQLLTLIMLSLLVSGGADGNGGAPDMDIEILGIGAHRSPFTHSILMGVALETAVLALMELARLAHGHLPEQHDPLWDTLKRHAEGLAHAATMGIGMGMAYHLFVDALMQPAPYHDLPFAMPMESHQALFAANAAAEAIDVAHKPMR
jgi:hypothetical protein